MFVLPLITNIHVEIGAHAGRECTAPTIVKLVHERNSYPSVETSNVALSVVLMSCGPFMHIWVFHTTCTCSCCDVWIQAYQCRGYPWHHPGGWIIGISVCKLIVKYYSHFSESQWFEITCWATGSVLVVVLHGEPCILGTLPSCHWGLLTWKVIALSPLIFLY